MGFENLNGLSFGDAKSEVRNAYKNEGRTCAGVQAWFATVGQVMGIGYNSVREALANGSVVGDTIMLRGCKTHDVIEIESGNSATSKEISGVSAKAVWMNPSKSSIYYGSSGYPKDLRRAKQMALGFASKMRDLHASGKVHGGVGSDSLVLDQTGGVSI